MLMQRDECLYRVLSAGSALGVLLSLRCQLVALDSVRRVRPIVTANRRGA